MELCCLSLSLSLPVYLFLLFPNSLSIIYFITLKRIRRAVFLPFIYFPFLCLSSSFLCKSRFQQKKKYFPWELNCREREEKKSNRLGELKDARVVCATLSLYIKRKRSFFFFRFILHHSRGSLPPFCCELSSYCL